MYECTCVPFTRAIFMLVQEYVSMHVYIYIYVYMCIYDSCQRPLYSLRTTCMYGCMRTHVYVQDPYSSCIRMCIYIYTFIHTYFFMTATQYVCIYWNAFPYIQCTYVHETYISVCTPLNPSLTVIFVSTYICTQACVYTGVL